MLLIQPKKVTFCYIIFHYFRFMAILEDTVNLPLCGLFLAIFSLLCFDDFSAVTVQYSHNHSRQSGSYSHTSDSFDSSESRLKTFTCFCAKVNIGFNFVVKIHKRILKKYNQEICFPTGRKQTRTQKFYSSCNL
jgi:hypothetical protein